MQNQNIHYTSTKRPAHPSGSLKNQYSRNIIGLFQK